ncbi:MAG: thioredoxin domain-containing protein, partial [Bacillota bacterium]
MTTNGIAWREWGQEAFDEATRQRKPILLDISAVWCHWCHVMDEKVYSDPEVIAKANSDFIPVRVDTDRRPDVNSRYNMGGWPTTAFLTPEGEILTGATYLPPEDMRTVLSEVASFYRRHATELGERLSAEGLKKRGTRNEAPEPGGGLSRDEALEAAGAVVSKLDEAYDEHHGGFGMAPKFPHAKALDLLLVTYLRSAPGEEPRKAFGRVAAGRCLDMAEKTLKAMRQGGMYDQVAGGFFRYSTTRDWEVPHYEKMLEDNSELLAVYARAARLTGDPFYAGTVRDVARYLLASLRSEEGFFFGSQDADEDYYKLGEEARGRREPPRTDRTLYSGWNALAARGLAGAYLATGEVRLREAGLVALEYVWVACRTGGGLLAHYLDESGTMGPVLLQDNADFAVALLDAYEVTGEESFLKRASGLIRTVREEFGGDGPGFYDTLAGGEKPGHLRFRQKGLTENARFALAMMRLADITLDPEPRRIAEETLARFLGPHRRHGILAADYALALDWAAGPTAEIVVSGDPAGETTAELAFQAASAPSAARVVRRAPAGEGEEPVAYICSGRTCLEPIRDPSSLA